MRLVLIGVVSRTAVNMLTLILCGLLVAVSVSGERDCTLVSCDERFIQFNLDHNCLPVKEDGHCCPTSFNCPTAETHIPSKCHVKGHSYDIGTDLKDEQFDDKCLAHCSCVADPEDSAKAHLQCINIECPSDLGVPPPDSCTFTFSHTQCCHTGTNCNVTDATTFTCQHGDHSHRIGEKFYPDDEPCYECICMDGYDGTVKEPWCKRVTCGIPDSHHEGCAPIFMPGQCCPIGWRCPKEGEGITFSSVSPMPEGSPKCRFGTDEKDIGYHMHFDADTCLDCKCHMPPYFSCEKKPDCGHVKK